MGDRASAKPRATNYDPLHADDLCESNIEEESVIGETRRKRPSNDSSASISGKKLPKTINLLDDQANTAVKQLSENKNKLVFAQLTKLERENRKQLISDMEEFVGKHPTWSKERILLAFPYFVDVIDFK